MNHPHQPIRQLTHQKDIGKLLHASENASGRNSRKENAAGELVLTVLEVIRRHEPAATFLAHDLCLPPPVVLKAQHSEDVAFCEAELLGDLCRVQVHRTSCSKLASVLSLPSFIRRMQLTVM